MLGKYIGTQLSPSNIKAKKLLKNEEAKLSKLQMPIHQKYGEKLNELNRNSAPLSDAPLSELSKMYNSKAYPIELRERVIEDLNNKSRLNPYFD